MERVLSFFNKCTVLLVFSCHIFVGGSVLDEVSGEEVDCSNILNYVQSYLELSTMDHTLLSMSAHRFSAKAHIFLPGAIIPDNKKPNKEELESFKSDISDTVDTIQQNQNVLIQKTNIIREVLPECLK